MGREEDAPHRRRIRRSSSSESMTSLMRREARRLRLQSPHYKKKQHAVYPYWWLMVISAMFSSPTSLYSKGNRFDETALEIEKWQSNCKKDLFHLPEVTNERHFDSFKPLGIRWRDDLPYLFRNRVNATVMPILTERRPMLEHHHRSVASTTPSLTMTPTHSRASQEPSLEDIELIDLLWRSDLTQEKGGPAEQYERDLQTLTEKSVHAPLSREDASSYEDLHKDYFEEFYNPGCPYSTNSIRQPCSVRKELFPCEASVSHVEPVSPLVQPKIGFPTPTDAQQDILLEDVWKEGGPLDRLESAGHVLGVPTNQQPLLHNVSLGVSYTAANLTEIDMMVGRSADPFSAVNHSEAVGGVMNPPPFNTTNFWYNHTDGPISCYLRRDAMSNMTMAVEQMPAMPPPAPVLAPTLTEIGVLPNGHYSGIRNHSTQTQTSQPSTSTNLNNVYDPYYGRRSLSMSNESSVCSSASSSSTSPRYGSETENYSPVQCSFYGKLAPLPKDEDNIYYEDDAKNSVVRMTPCLPGSQAPRRRGRQSKDEQLAAAFHLPVSAADIADMTLPDLQKMLRSEDLTEDQKQLIRKIRRRGKNKVAARTCRLRRGEMRTTHLTPGQMHWMEAPRTLFRRQ